MRRGFTFLLLLVFTCLAFGQQNRQFTLDELIPGGKNYARYVPRIAEQYQWHGDELMMLRGDSVFRVDLADPVKKRFLFRFSEIPEEGREGRTVSTVSFDREGSGRLKFFTADGAGVYDLGSKQVISFIGLPENSENREFSPNGLYMAYTRANNLYVIDAAGEEIAISSEENSGIVFGQSVHRNEFGINGGIFWSPDGSKLAFYRMDESMVAQYPIVDISARIATEKPVRYPMAGEKSHEVTIGVYDLKSRQTIYLKTGEPREKYLTNVAWSPDARHIYVAELNREQNHLKMNRYDASTGDFDKTLFEETHPKYVEPENPVLFVRNNPEQFIWQSERDGFNHLYLYHISGRLLKQLTHGEWEVTDLIGFDRKGEQLFFVSTLATPIERHACRVNLKNGKIDRLTAVPGMHTVTVSNSGRYLVTRYTAHDNPGKVDLVDSKKGGAVTLAAARNPFAGISMPAVELGILKAADGKTDLYYRMVKPANFDPARKYPVVVYVYGGPHSQLVQNRWRYGSGGWETYMAQKGYIVFVMDNRGTSFRGRDFEDVTHRQLGVEEAKDQMCGVEYLKSLPYVDPDRMGIHGWSFGGFMTINMLLRYPDLFRAGVAGGPVTDWSYYEVMYGERYMDTPQENPEGYAETSLLRKADRLKSRLLIIHGDEDPVVVMQHSLQFLKSSIASGRHPDFFIYPGHEHNMIGRDRVHLHEHITRYFDDFCR